MYRILWALEHDPSEINAEKNLAMMALACRLSTFKFLFLIRLKLRSLE